MKWSAVFSSIYLTMIYVFTPCVGMIGRLLMPDIAAPDTIFPELLLKYTPAVFAALIISGALAAAMSTGDSQLHATSTMVATDIYKKFVNKKANENTLYNVAKIGVLIIGFGIGCFCINLCQQPSLICWYFLTAELPSLFRPLRRFVLEERQAAKEPSLRSLR